MWKTVIVIVAFISMMFFQNNLHGNSQITESNQSVKLNEITNVMNKLEIEIDSWTLYTREDRLEVRNKQQYERRLAGLKAEFVEFSWEESIEDNLYKSVGTYRSAESSIEEQIKFVAYLHEDSFKTYVIYEVKGEEWNIDHWQAFSPIFQAKIGLLFDKNPQLFTCVSGLISGNISSVLYNQALMIAHEFSAEPIEALQEETFVSLSAYTENWKNSIPVKNGDMNIQIALRNQGLGDSTSVVIGTPIITSEY